MRSLIALALVAAAHAASSGARAGDVAIAAPSFTRCAVCHQKTGAGIPGVFPPLRANLRMLARSNPGRAYVIAVVTRGVSGPLGIDGQTYRGAMPAQGSVKDDDLAELLNSILSSPADPAATTPFTPAEVARLRAEAQGKDSAEVAKLRP